MTYQEILQAIERLPLEQQDRLLALVRQQQQQTQHGGSERMAIRFGDLNANGESTNDLANYHFIERTPEETARGLQDWEKFFQKKRDLWNDMTEEERQISDSQFAMLDEYLNRSTGTLRERLPHDRSGVQPIPYLTKPLQSISPMRVIAAQW
jgi:hypothetical protein